MADAIITAEPDLMTVSDPTVRCGRTIVPLPLQVVNDADVAVAPQRLFAEPGKASFLERVDAWKMLNTDRLRKRDGANLQVEIQVVALGDQFAIASLPHEIFVELGMMIRDASPFPVTCVVSLAQDLDFYIPTRKAFAEGSYEVTTSSIQPGGGEEMAQAAIRLLQEVAKQPTRPE